MILLNVCDNGDILSVIRITYIVIGIIKIAVPIILMITLMIDFTKAINGKDSDTLAKINKTAVSKCIAAILVFYIPTFITLIANITSYDKDTYFACVNNATPEGIEQAYIKTAQKLVNIAKEQLTEPTYNTAYNAVIKLKEGEEKNRLLKELEEIKKAIEEKRKKEEEERLSHQSNEKGWWFPVGGSEVTVKNGKEFASGTPVGTRLTAYFGGNDPVHQGLGGGHGAIDIGVNRGTYVIASRSGTVVRPGAGERIDYPENVIKPDENGKYNCNNLPANYVKIDHGDGTMSGYAHFLANTITVRAGDEVKQGQIIGKVGSSGCASGPHLHFEIFVNNVAVDPLDYVDGNNPRP